MQCEVWEGFIFVNLDPDNTVSAKEYLGELGAGLEGYPFDEMTQVYKYRAEVGSNWKLFIDAFAEFYHAPVLHAKQATAEESRKLSGYGYEALAYEIDGPHGMVSSWGGMAPPKDLNMVKPIERVLRERPLRSVGTSRPAGLDEPAAGAQPRSQHRAWGVDSFVFFPNFMLLVWAPGWYLTYHYWPTSYNTHIFEGTLYFVPAEDRHRAAPPGARRGDVQGVRAPGRQHPRGHPVDDRDTGRAPSSRSTTRRSSCATSTRRRATTSPTTRSAGSTPRSRSRPPPDEEHSDVHDPSRRVRRPRALRRPGRSRTEAERYAERLGVTRWTSCRRSTTPPSRGSPPPWPTSTQLDLNALPDDATRLLWLCYSLVNVSFPIEVWHQPRVPDSGAATMDAIVEPAV